MKAAALYHLLQIRARKLEEGADSASTMFMREVQESLAVEYADSEYRLSWSHAGRPYVLTVAGDTFGFYLAGDTAAATVARKFVTGYRAINWRKAAAVWQEVASTSGVSALFSPDQSMGLVPPQVKLRSASWLQPVVLGSPAAILAVALAAGGRSIEPSVVALFSTVLAALLCAMPPRQRLTLLEATVVSVAAVVPSLYGFAPTLLIGPMAGMVLVSVSERMTGPWSAALWSLGGIILGFSAVTSMAAAVSVGVLAVALSGTAVLTPTKLPRRGIAFLTLGLAIGLAIAALPVGEPARLVSQAFSGTNRLVAAALGGALVIGFFLWCIHDVLFRVVPWISILALGSFSIAAAVIGDAAPAFSTSGVAVFLTVRIVRSWVASNRTGAH